MQQDTASENISKQFGYILVSWRSTITPVWSCEHLLAKSSVWRTHVTHPGSWAACSEVHHFEKTELLEKSWSALELSCKGVWVEALFSFISRLLPLPVLQLCLLSSFPPLWRRTSSCGSRDTLLLTGRNPRLPWTCPGSNSRPAQFLVVVLLPQ